MQVSTSSITGVGNGTLIPAKGMSPLVGFGVVVSGTITYSVQHTFDGVNFFDHESVVDQTANADGNYAFPAAGYRLVTTAGTGTATLSLIQM